jgi:hypothetical protein
MIMANFDYENDHPPNRFIEAHFQRAKWQKEQDPNHQLKLKFSEREKETPIKRKDEGQHVLSVSADQFYHDIKFNESLKQTRLQRRMHRELHLFDRSVPTKKTVSLDKYKEYIG